MTEPWIVVGYYTKDSLYEERTKIFMNSLILNRVVFYIEPIDDLGSWFLNTNYKPTFLKRMLGKFPHVNIIYVDVDAKFFHYPKLFDELDCDIAVHHLDRQKCWGGNQRGRKEVLSGTIFLRNNDKVKDLIRKWEIECIKNPKTWDQKSLEKIIPGDFYRLPGEYCKIHDKMNYIKDPVIIHYQASRRMRRAKKRRNLK